MLELAVVRRAIASLVLITLAGCGDGGTGPSTETPGLPTGPGAIWTAVTPPPGGTHWSGVAFGNGVWVASGNGVRGTSSNGSAWTSVTTTSPDYFKSSVTFANGIFVSPGSQRISTSTNGTSWSGVTLSEAQSVGFAAFGNGTWVVTDDRFLYNDVVAFWTSTTNGAGWNQVTTTIPYASPTSIAFGNGTFVVVGYGSLVASSTNATTWVQRSLGSTSLEGVLAITFANNLFVAVTNTGNAYRSADGISWTKATVGVNGLYGITYGNGQFVAVGLGASLYVSTNGATWTKRTWPGGSVQFNAVTFGNNRFVAVGSIFALSQ